MSNSLWPHGLQHARIPVLHDLPEFAQTHVKNKSVMLSNHLILCDSLLLPLIFPSTRVSFNELALWIRRPKYCFSISPSNEYSGLIFRIDWFDLPAVQGTLKSPPTPQFKSFSSSALSLLYGPTLTSIQDYWKNHSFRLDRPLLAK